MSAFYNEIEAYPAQWMRNLIDAGHIAPGVVDERSIVDLEPKDLEGYEQAHFFAGIGVWSHALRLAGWSDGAGVWTGSCPCQPFSSAGKRGGHADERHLWPAWFRLIRECRPRVVFGEQVASKDGLAWLDAVRADMEGEGYAFGAVDIPAAGVGAPHIRQRAFFVAYDAHDGRARQQGARQRRSGAAHDGATGELADADRAGQRPACGRVRDQRDDSRRGGSAGLVADAQRERGRGGTAGIENAADAGAPGEAGGPGRSGFWSDAEWVWCRDNCWRPHGPESFPLTVAHGATARVGRDGSEEEARPSRVGMLRAYGNAIVAPVAAQFIAAFMDVIESGVVVVR